MSKEVPRPRWSPYWRVNLQSTKIAAENGPWRDNVEETGMHNEQYRTIAGKRPGRAVWPISGFQGHRPVRRLTASSDAECDPEREEP
jgi:hypothetical protein